MEIPWKRARSIVEHAPSLLGPWARGHNFPASQTTQTSAKAVAADAILANERTTVAEGTAEFPIAELSNARSLSGRGQFALLASMTFGSRLLSGRPVAIKVLDPKGAQVFAVGTREIE